MNLNTNPEIAQFLTRERANEGIRVPLYDPVKNEETEHWIHVQGVDSDAYQKAYAAARRRLSEAMASKKPAEALALLDAQKETLDMLVSVVTGWSFKTLECTPENVRKVFIDAPQIADALSTIISRRSLFFAKKSENSASSPAPTSI